MNTGYRIGAVAKLTGISTDTIRAWERRYHVVEPNRGENNNRYYSEHDVRKLINVKRLVDAGQAIGTICRLSEHELKERTSGLLGVERQLGASGRWAVFSVQQPGWLKACLETKNSQEITWFNQLSDIDFRTFGFVVIDMPSLSETSEREINQAVSPEVADRCLVVYRFASRNQLRALTARGFRLLKGPLEPYALANLLSATSSSGEEQRVFTDHQLHELSEVPCEISRDLSQLVADVNRLEDRLNGECISGQVREARSSLEKALKEVIARSQH